MKVKKKYWEQFVPKSIEEVWHFFSTPENLDKITPKDMSFETVPQEKEGPIYAGMIIQHRIAPLLGIKMDWVTEISQVKIHEYFIDEQRFGPYAFWHHQHFFEPVEGGVLVKDLIHYKVPFGIIGTLANILFVESKIESIFKYRQEVLESVMK